MCNLRLEFIRSTILILVFIMPLRLSSQEIEEVIVTVDYIPDEKLQTAEVSDILDADDISIAGDSTVGDALKRLPGLSLVGGKHIYVRGLGERYSATYFNGTSVPSPIPMQRSVPLDIFGTSIIQNLLVQKTYSPNYGAEFSGGIVDIRSSALPDEGFFKLKFSSGYNDLSTNNQGLTYDGGSSDWTGYDDGTRSLPSEFYEQVPDRTQLEIDNGIETYIDYYPQVFGVPQTLIAAPSADEQDVLRLSFNNRFDIYKQKNPYDYSLSLGAGNRWYLADTSLGASFRLSLDDKTRNSLIKRFRHTANNQINSNPYSDDQLHSMHAEGLSDGSVLSSYGFTPGQVDRTIRTIRLNALL
jgi:hypothetical protein